MGRKREKGEYNDFLEDTRVRDNNAIHTTLQSTSTLTRNVSPPTTSRQNAQQRNTTHSKGKNKKPPLTHFLCLPLVTAENRPRLENALENLRTDVERLTPVPPKAVKSVGTLHLTLGVMSLDASRLADAQTYLNNLDALKLLHGITTQTIAEVAKDSTTVGENFGAVANPTAGLGSEVSAAMSADLDSLSVDLKGLVPMQKARQTSILYAEPRDKSGRLLRFAESLRAGFEERGWIIPDNPGLRLHATVLNTIYTKPRNRGRGKQNTTSQTPPDTAVPNGTEIDRDHNISDAESSQPTIGNPKLPTDGSSGHGPNAKSWLRFDASALIEAWSDYVWAEDVRLDRVQICRMGAKKVWSEGEGKGVVVDEKYEVVCEKILKRV